MEVVGVKGKLLKVNEVSDILHVHPNTLRKWSNQGRIGTFRIGSRGDRRFREEDISRFVAEFDAYK